MWRVFLVPEDGRKTPTAALGKQVDDLGTGAGSSSQLVLPVAVIAVPRGLNENEIEIVELVRPYRSGKRDGGPLEA